MTPDQWKQSAEVWRSCLPNLEIRDFMSDVPERKTYREIIPIGCRWHGLKKCNQCSGGFHLGVGVADRWYLWLAASWKLKFLEWSLRQR